MWPNGLLNIISRAGRSDSRAYLTFDDGPDPEYTPAILQVLAAHRVKASFFVLGQACEEHPGLVRRMLDEGHSLGIHGYHHFHPWRMREQQAREEVRRTYHALLAITGVAPCFFRPAYGRVRLAMLQEAKALNMHTVLWSRSVMDWGWWGTMKGVKRRLEAVSQGDIVLMHDGRPGVNRPQVTLSLLADFLRSSHIAGLGFASLNQLLQCDNTRPQV